MQDLQVTIEVRFITLDDNFFERIGVDFDFNIAKNIANPQAAGFTAPQVQRQRPLGPELYRQHQWQRVGSRSHRRAPAMQNPAYGHGHLYPGPEHPLLARQLCPGGAAIRRFRRHGGRHGGVRDPQRHRGLLLYQCRAGRQAHERPPGPQGHAVQRPAGLRLRHLANAFRDQRDPRGGRLRRGPTAGDRRAFRRHVHDRAGRGLQRPPLRAPDDRALLQQDRQRADLHLPGKPDDHDRHHAERHRQSGHEPVQQQPRNSRRTRNPA